MKSTLSIVTTYYMPLFTIPVSVSNRLKKLQRDCLCLLGKGGVSGGKESSFGLSKIGGYYQGEWEGCTLENLVLLILHY